jgi:hypothetical protein
MVIKSFDYLHQDFFRQRILMDVPEKLLPYVIRQQRLSILNRPYRMNPNFNVRHRSNN